MEGDRVNTRVLTFEGFQGSVEVSTDDNCLYGRVLHIDDLITYEAESPGQLKAAFEDAIRDYRAFCEEEGKEPNKPFKGSLNIRIGPNLHEAAAKRAAQDGVSLNDFIRDAVSTHLAGPKMVQEIHHHDHKHYSVAVEETTEEYGYFNENGFVQCQEQNQRQLPNQKKH